MSEIVSTATGRALEEYAEEVLFRPIGIKESFWKSAPEGFRDVSPDGACTKTPIMSTLSSYSTTELSARDD